MHLNKIWAALTAVTIALSPLSAVSVEKDKKKTAKEHAAKKPQNTQNKQKETKGSATQKTSKVTAKNAQKTATKTSKAATQNDAKVAVTRNPTKTTAKKVQNIASTKNTTKIVAKKDAKLATKSIQKNATKTTAKNTSKSAVKSDAKVAAKGTPKSTAKNTSKAATKNALKSSVKHDPRVTERSTPKTVAKNVQKSTVKNELKAATKNTQKEVTKKSSHPGIGVTNSRDAQTGEASFYAAKFNGQRTANGEIYSDRLMTGAHRTLPLGSYVKVTNLRNSKQVVVKINDRGPFSKGRIIDLSRSAASAIGMVQTGVAQVKIEPIKGYKPITSTSTIEKNATKTMKVFVKAVVKTTKEADKLAKLQKNTTVTRVGKHYQVTLPASSQKQAVKIKQKVAKLGPYPLFIYTEQ